MNKEIDLKDMFKPWEETEVKMSLNYKSIPEILEDKKVMEEIGSEGVKKIIQQCTEWMSKVEQKQ